jgi:predicted nucleotidyltransferase component of viral defense system
MLDPAEAAAVASEFGVAAEQVRRDHLISHLLAALSTVPSCTDRLTFIGGTALARTHLPHGRLSEDIDLVATEARQPLASEIERALDRGVRREFGRLRWTPALHTVRAVEHAVVQTADGLWVRVQLLPGSRYPNWPTEVRAIEQRYTDAPSASLRLLTLPAFVAAKTAAWADRRAARDLFDLYQLAAAGAIDDHALDLYVAHGPTGKPPPSWLFNRGIPSEGQWNVELAAQTRLQQTAREAAAKVRSAWTSATRSPQK